MRESTSFINQSAKKLNAPILATICPTEHCNLACRHCLGSYGSKSDKNELTFKTWMKVIESLKGAILKVEVSGGEPFISPKTLHLVRYIKKRKFCTISITTNGTLINQTLASALSKLMPQLQFIKVSLDGATAKVHEYIRGKNTYASTIKGIKLLRNRNIPVAVASMIHKETTIEDVEKMYELAAELDFSVQHGAIFPAGEALKRWKSLLPTPAMLNELSEFICKKEKELSVGNTITREEMEQEEYSIKRSLGRCSAGYKGIAIMSNGMLAACYLLSLNRFLTNIVDIWKNDSFLKTIRNYKRDDDMEICKKCQERTSCYKTCIGASYSVFGDFRAPSPYCILYHEQLDLDESLVFPYLKMLERYGIDLD
jgi:radical SAM protein with 4Fe4S-binding SPASM domain